MELTPDQVADAMEAASTDFKFLMDRENVPKGLQAKIFHAGVTSVPQFAAFAPDSEELRKSLKDDFELDPAAGLATKVTISRVVVAWEAAKSRAAKRAENEAECEVRQEIKPLRGSDFHVMRQNYEERWWKLDKEQAPAKAYIERICDGLEKGEPRAEPLTEVVNILEGEVDILKAVWDAGGSIKAVRTHPTVALPRDPEELRERINLLGWAWAFVASSQPNCAYVQGGTPQLWGEYLDYLLGNYCYKLYARDAYGAMSATPPWNLVLSYELAIRREMVDLMVQGTPITEALKKAWKDPVIKERNFTTPLAITSASRRGEGGEGHKRNQKRQYEDAFQPNGKGKGKQKKKGKAKGKAKGQDDCQAQTPDGKKICFRFNDQGRGCAAPKCQFLHVCGRCYKDHPMFRCDA